jgi:5-methyltetrahydrofolate--homocysteine methyltransferase
VLYSSENHSDLARRLMNGRPARIESLKAALADRILVLDGAMGTAIQNRDLTASDFGGPDLEGCNENLILTRPDVISDIMKQYLEAGADILETNTFGATPLVLAEYGLSEKSYEINFESARLAREAAEEFSTAARPRFVAGSMGPTTKAISVTGGVTFDELITNYYEQAKALFEGGVDYFLLETCQDTRNIKAGLVGIQKLFDEKGETIPIAVSGTIEPMGTMLAGQDVEALATSLEHLDLLYIGLNCATGPEFMTDHIRVLAQESGFRVACVPNAGLPDEFGKYLETPASLASVIRNFAEQGWLNLVGGCCGTTPPHIKALADMVQGVKPHVTSKITGSLLSGLERVEISDDRRPYLVGERTNVIGSKKFKEMVVAEKWAEAAEIAKHQVKNGAHIVDLCLANPDRDEKADMKNFLEAVVRQIKAPLMIDSTDPDVFAMGLTYCQGKAILNSINLEDGEERFEQVLPMAKKFGAAVVVGCIDDDPIQSMAITKERKLQVAERSHKLLTEKYKIPDEDIYWDTLVFPCGTGDEQYVGSAAETIEGIRLVKERFPKTKTILGISNVSFGLPGAGREVLNSVFLYHCTQAGLDLAIVNTEKLMRYPQIPEEEKRLADDLIFNRNPDAVANFTAHFRTKKVVPKPPKDSIPVEDRLANYIIEGTKDGLVEDLAEVLKKLKPLEVINGPLMKGMDEVGRLFNSNQLIVAEVLQSAESMKAAVNYLEPFMDKNADAERGKLLLATVKGDVHDIGKNLVDIILSNNGFKVINLGIKVPPDVLIQAAREHNPDFIGLSGLLVKSAQQMVITAKDLAAANIHVPILVGGAALSRNFVDRQIAPAYSGFVDYASDAMHGLELAKKLVDKDVFSEHSKTVDGRRGLLEANAAPKVQAQAVSEERSPEIKRSETIPAPPDFERHVVKNVPIEVVWRYINPLMLYVRHLGLKPKDAKTWVTEGEAGLRKTPEGEKALKIFEAVEEVKRTYRSILVPKAVYQYISAKSVGNKIILNDDVSLNPFCTLEFPRQKRVGGLCLADYVEPLDSPRRDNLAMFAVTVGENIRGVAEKLKNQGEYLHSIILQVLAIESAEGLAEMLHEQIRKHWGYPDSVDTTMMARFQAKYHGKRYSFGYPACPDLSSQKQLFEILNPKDIGVELTEGFMMDPEASVSAIVFHHEQATYFSVGE